jgi:hypothetical protein
MVPLLFECFEEEFPYRIREASELLEKLLERLWRSYSAM